ncbi:MAG TPA: phage shock protein A [Actinobacteria bacterium]|nr:phage shock protein A [Actinomycetota bacterium]
MGVARRIAELYEVKVNALLDRLEDPREMLDYSYAQQQAMLHRLQQQATEVAASRHLAQMQETQLQRSADRLQDQAEQAVAAGKEELARQALAWRSAILVHIDDLRAEQVALRADEEQLTASARRLQRKIEAFGLHKETIKASYTAAKASASVSQLVGGATEEMGDVGIATRRAEETTARLQARAQALEELLAAEGPGGPAPSASLEQVQAQLDAVTTKAVVEEELARIKARLATGAGTPAGKPPEGKTPAGNTPAGKTPAGKPAAGNTPAGKPAAATAAPARTSSDNTGTEGTS